METVHLQVAPRALREFVALFIRAALSILPHSVAGLSQGQGDRELAEGKHTDRLKTVVLHIYYYKKVGRERSHSHSSEKTCRVAQEQPG